MLFFIMTGDEEWFGSLIKITKSIVIHMVKLYVLSQIQILRQISPCMYSNLSNIICDLIFIKNSSFFFFENGFSFLFYNFMLF